MKKRVTHFLKTDLGGTCVESFADVASMWTDGATHLTRAEAQHLFSRWNALVAPGTLYSFVPDDNWTPEFPGFENKA